MTMYDLGKLNGAELELLERLLSKAAGDIVGDVDVPFRIELVRHVVDTSTAEPTAGDDALSEIRALRLQLDEMRQREAGSLAETSIGVLRRPTA
jgi:hypothetical protein